MGEFRQHVFSRFAKLGAVFDEIMATGTARGIDAAGHGVHRSPILRGKVGGDERAAGPVGFHNHRTLRHASYNAVADWKALLVAFSPEGKLRDNRALFGNPLIELYIFSRIHDV